MCCYARRSAVRSMEWEAEGSQPGLDHCQRQEAASMLHRLGALRADYDGSVQGRLPHVFADGADIASWARNDINWVYRHGIMSGDGRQWV